MSRVGKLPISVPTNIKLTIDGDLLNFDSGGEKRTYRINPEVSVEFSLDQIKLSVSKNNSSNSSVFVGMDRSNIKNIVLGLSSGFKKVLEINGVGYKASIENSTLILSLGYSHEIYYVLPKGISASFEKPNLIIIKGSDNVLVGQVAAEIKSFRKTEPYKGKGIKALGEQILRKEGKKK